MRKKRLRESLRIFNHKAPTVTWTGITSAPLFQDQIEFPNIFPYAGNGQCICRVAHLHQDESITMIFLPIVEFRPVDLSSNRDEKQNQKPYESMPNRIS